MSKLLLVRHCAPAADPCVAAAQWPLSPDGRRRCGPLAEVLRPYLPFVLVSSREAKAAETAAGVASALGLRYETRPGLHEHTRTNVGWLSEAEFRAGVTALFERPGEVVFGEESADQAHARFAAALATVLDEHRPANVAIVTHGTVLSLYVSRVSPGVAAVGLWERLGLPAVVVLDRETLAVEQVIEAVEADER